MRVAAEGRGLIYTSASFSGQSDFVSQEFCICVNTVVTKSACPTAAEKRLSASICLCRRCRSQPLSSVSRKQRYNTLDFAEQNRVPTGMLLAPIGNPEPRGYSPLDTLLFLAAMVSTLSKLGGFHAVKNVKSEKHFHHRVVVLRFSYMGYCLVFANSHVSAMAKAEGRTIFV